MKNKNKNKSPNAWEAFVKTGHIDAYLEYKKKHRALIEQSERGENDPGF